VPDLETSSPKNCSVSRAERGGNAADRAHLRGKIPGICLEHSGVDGKCLAYNHAVVEIATYPVQNEEEKQRQSGPGLVVMNRHLEEEPESDSFYVKRCGEALEIVEGSSLNDLNDVCGKVLFLCKPPARTAEARLDSYALISV
jgi:hypothetical protein